MGDDNLSNVVALRFDTLAALRQRLDTEVTEAFRAKELARAQVDALSDGLPEDVKTQLLLAASVYAQRLAAYVRAREAFERAFPGPEAA